MSGTRGQIGTTRAPPSVRAEQREPGRWRDASALRPRRDQGRRSTWGRDVPRHSGPAFGGSGYARTRGAAASTAWTGPGGTPPPGAACVCGTSPRHTNRPTSPVPRSPSAGSQSDLLATPPGHELPHPGLTHLDPPLPAGARRPDPHPHRRRRRSLVHPRRAVRRGRLVGTLVRAIAAGDAAPEALRRLATPIRRTPHPARHHPPRRCPRSLSPSPRAQTSQALSEPPVV